MQPDAERRAQHVRPRPTQSERRARRPQQDVVRPGCHRAHEREPEQRDKPSMAWTVGRRPATRLVRSCGDHRSRRAARRTSTPGNRGSRASARSSTPAMSSTPTRSIPTTSGPCSWSTRARSATTSTGEPSAPSRPWCRSFRPTSSTTAAPSTADGYRKRVIYLEPAVIGESLIGSAVDRPALPDHLAAKAVSALDRRAGLHR